MYDNVVLCVFIYLKIKIHSALNTSHLSQSLALAVIVRIANSCYLQLDRCFMRKDWFLVRGDFYKIIAHGFVFPCTIMWSEMGEATVLRSDCK